MMGFTFRRMASTGIRALAVSALFVAPALAQNAVVRGTVTSVDRKEPIAGVNVLIPELNLSVLTTDRGVYTLTVPAARMTSTPVTVTARGIGFKSMSRQVTLSAGEVTVDFALATDINRLEEVIVTGTLEGVERAKVPFSVGRLTTEDLPVPALDPIRALQGKVAGLRIAQTTGRPGTAPEIMLRGPTSINASGRSQEPLIIVDGVIMHVGSIQELGGLDIESVEVVKGAAGASLYGTQAANGVITITTKRGGSTDGVKFNARTEIGAQAFASYWKAPINTPNQLDESGKRFCVIAASGNQSCARTVDLMTEMYRINNVNSDTTRTALPIWYNTFATGDAALYNVFQANAYPNQYYNHMSQISDYRPTILSSVDATGKIGTVGFFVSGEYTTDPGVVKGLDGSNQRRARVNLDWNARSDLRISASSMFDNFYRDNRTAGVFGTLQRGAMPGFDMLARDTLGRLLVGRGSSGWRPTGNGAAAVLYDTENFISDRISNRFLGSLSAKYFPASWVTFEGVFGYDNRSRQDLAATVKGYRTFTISTANNNGNMTINDQLDEALNGALSATFRKKLGNDLNAKLRVAGGYDQEIIKNSNGTGQVFLVKDIYRLNNTSTNQSVSSDRTVIKNASASAAANFDYKDRYVLDASIRYDGSSLFGPGHRWAPFNRIAGVWIVSNEPFWNVGFMDELRFRASRGTAGSTPRFDAQYEVYNVGNTGISTGQAGNAALRPETTTEYEFGSDFTLFKKLGMEVTYAQGRTKDQILPVNVPASVGYSQQWQNAGTMLNKTWELAATLPLINNKSFYWQTRATFDRTRTYIDELFVPDFLYSGGAAQGTGSFFYMTADKRNSCLPGEEGHYPGEPGFGAGEARPNCTGNQLNRFGNIYGRRFYKSCTDLHVSLRDRCGEGKDFQVNNLGYVVYVGAGNSWQDGITKNLWATRLRAADSPWNYTLWWGMPIIDRPLAGLAGEGVGINQIIGNSLPDFRFTVSNDFSFKKFTVYGLLEGTMGHFLNNQSKAWGLLDLSYQGFDQAANTVETAKPLGYTWRAGGSEGAGVGGFYDQLGPNNFNVEKASFAKLRELSVTYKVGQIGGVGDWTFGLVGRNLLTITGYSGVDPEAGCGGLDGGGCGGATGPVNSGIVNQTDAFSFPTLRTLTFTVSTRF